MRSVSAVWLCEAWDNSREALWRKCHAENILLCKPPLLWRASSLSRASGAGRCRSLCQRGWSLKPRPLSCSCGGESVHYQRSNAIKEKRIKWSDKIIQSSEVSHDSIFKVAPELRGLIALDLPVLHRTPAQVLIQLGDVDGRSSLLILGGGVPDPVVDINGLGCSFILSNLVIVGRWQQPSNFELNL